MSSRKKPAREVEAPPPEPMVDEVLTEEPPLAAEPASDREDPREPALEEFARTKGRRKKKAEPQPEPIPEPAVAPPPTCEASLDESELPSEPEPQPEPEKPKKRGRRAAPEASPPADEPTQADGAPSPDEPTPAVESLLSEPDAEEEAAIPGFSELDVEMTVNVAGDVLDLPGRDDLDEPTINVDGHELERVDEVVDQRRSLRGCLEALVFASDVPIKPKDLAKLASAPLKDVVDLLDELRQEYQTRGIQLEEVAGGWVFRTSAEHAAVIRDLRKERPVRLSRAQVETLAIIAYRQPVTRPEIDDVRGVDSGPVLKVLLERDLIRILGKRDEVGRPIIYGTTNAFLEFFGLNSLKDLPTLREFTELTDESREKYEEELGELPVPPPPEPPPPTAASEATRAEYERMSAEPELDDGLSAEEEPTDIHRRSDTLVDEAELNNEPTVDEDDVDDDVDEDEDDDDVDEDEDDDDDDEDDVDDNDDDEDDVDDNDDDEDDEEDDDDA